MTNQSIVSTALRVHGPMSARELADLHHHWSKLDHRLRSFVDRTVTLDLHVQERDTPSQRVVLETVVAGFETFVATDTSADLSKALNRVRDETIRQITDAKNRTEPRNNRRPRQR